MTLEIRRVTYTTTRAPDRPGSAFEILDDLARAKINLLALTCVPIGPGDVQLTLYPEDIDRLESLAPKMGLTLTREQEAILVQGDDEIGVLTGIHRQLADAQINVYATHGVTVARGSFGYLIHLRPDDVDRACDALGC